MFPGNGIPAPPLSRSFFLRHVFAPFRPMAPSLLILPGLGISPGWSCQAFICTKESSCDVLQKGTDCCRPDFLPCSRGIFLPHRCGISPSSCRPQNTGPFEWTTKHPSSDPKNKGILGQQKIVFHFLGSQKFFIGIIVQSFEKNGRLLHHGLFDQGPIDEVLSRALFHKEERVQVLGIYRENGRYTLHLKRFATGKVQSFPLDSALRILMTHIGSKPDLCWAAR